MTDRGSDPDRRPRDDPELAALVEELSTTLETLQDAVGEQGNRVTGPRSPPGPAPPSPRDLLRFTERYTIPTLIALLESGVRSLELLRATLRLLDGRGVEDASPATRQRVESVGRTTLDRVDRVLSDLGTAVEGGEPTDPDARDLLSDARALREEIDRQLRALETGERERDRSGTASRTSGRDSAERRDIPIRPADRSDEGSNDDADDDVPVDVDAELDSIREDVAGERGDTPPGTDDAGEDTDEDGGAGGGDGSRR